jgi:hypothetical protein
VRGSALIRILVSYRQRLKASPTPGRWRARFAIEGGRALHAGCRSGGEGVVDALLAVVAQHLPHLREIAGVVRLPELDDDSGGIAVL